MKTCRPILFSTLLTCGLAALPAFAGVSIDRTSPSVGPCGVAVNPASILSQVAPGPPCAVPEVLAGSLGLIPADNVDAVSANTWTPPGANYTWVFSADRAAVGVGGSNYAAEAAVNQAASDLWRTLTIPSTSPAAVIAAACGAPALIPPPAPIQHRVQVDFHLIPTLPSGVAFAGNQDNIDAVELDDLDPSGDRVHDVGVYFSLDPASPSLGGGSGANLFFAPPGAAKVAFSLAGNVGLLAGDDIDALVMWDRGAIGVMNPGLDIAVFSLTPGSPSRAGADGVLGTADDFSPGDLLVTDFAGFFCIYTRPGQLGMLATDNIDGLDAYVD